MKACETLYVRNKNDMGIRSSQSSDVRVRATSDERQRHPPRILPISVDATAFLSRTLPAPPTATTHQSLPRRCRKAGESTLVAVANSISIRTSSDFRVRGSGRRGESEWIRIDWRGAVDWRRVDRGRERRKWRIVVSVAGMIGAISSSFLLR